MRLTAPSQAGVGQPQPFFPRSACCCATIGRRRNVGAHLAQHDRIADGPLSFTPAKVLNPRDPPFNALCDGATDDTAALTGWSGAVTAGTHVVVPGSCVFKSPLTFPSVDQVTVDGGGALIYQGTATTGNILTFGSPNAASGCSIREWSIRNVRFLTNTVMSAASASIRRDCDGELSR